MFLSKPCFPVTVQKEELEGIAKEALKERHWHNFKISSTSLVFSPFYFFSYDAFFEEKSEETGALVVKDTQAGSMALNAVSGEFDEGIAGIADSEEPVMLKESPAPEGVEVEVERASISESEVKRISPIRLAATLGVARHNVEISKLSLAFVPFWLLSLQDSSGKSFELSVNAVNGEVLESEEIPFREKGALELTGETISELKKPSAWLDYSKRVLARIAGSGILHSIGKALLTNRIVQVIILVIIALIVFWPR
ncbi:MAG: hypothetical protein J4478_04945 [Candidatus Diapherotrites archaeon]|uniref:Uncharacterized protein n=1 Tax=Candidatus Iainarchaeum sp. TaxID=3101447 RepID=A0A8T4KX25_9ARCH|nr:hypothetical protein [Candidatus Diapherotrites archaeon]